MSDKLTKNSLFQKNSQGTNINNLTLFNSLQGTKINLVSNLKLNQKLNIDAYTKSLTKKSRIKNGNPTSKTIKFADISNKQNDIVSNHQRLKWITTDDFCSRHTKYITYANVKKYDGHNSHTYFINAQKDGTFYLHIVIYYDCNIKQNQIEDISEVCSTMKEAKKRVNNHYLNNFILTKLPVNSKCE